MSSPRIPSHILPQKGLQETAGSLTPDIDRLAQLGSNLIMEGEPGVGKRFCAYLIHMKRQRGRAASFVEITPEMSEEEMKAILFDEDRRRQEGVLGRPIPRLDLHSTLFIRRVNQFSLLEQTRLARFLTQNESNTVQGKPAIRVITSTPIPWPEVIRGKNLVDSLTQHMAAFERFMIPPLRERKQDIPGIVLTILRELSKKLGVRELRVGAGTLVILAQHQWWDNVRELRLVIEESAVTSADDALLLPARFFDESEMVFDLMRSLQSGKRSSIEDALGFLEKSIVQRALMHCGFDYGKACRLLNLTEQNLRYRIKKHSIYVPAGEK